MEKTIKKQFHTIENFWVSDNWLGNRMLFLSGPRQVGKTTLVQSTLCKKQDGYFNWDNRKVRMLFQKDPDFFSSVHSTWICFDEIHKRPKWKDILKGIYDSYKNQFKFAITGSARLDTFKRSGDSLVGRYFHTHLHPLNLPDFHKHDFQLPKDPLQLMEIAKDLKGAKELEDLLAFGGFPEPFFSGSDSFWKRWSANHRDLIINEDIRDITRVVEIDKIDQLLQILDPSIGSLVSYRNLANDLEATHVSIKRWLEILHRVHLVFPVPPYSKNIRRAYKTEKKWYYTDWRSTDQNRFENFVACSLNRACELYEDRFGDKMSLHFVRTHDGAEVDFLLTKNKRPWLLIEVKEGTPEATSAVYRFSKELNVPCFVVTRKKNIFRNMTGLDNQKICFISWDKFGQILP